MELTVFKAGDFLPNGGARGYLRLGVEDVVLITEGADLYTDRPMGAVAGAIYSSRGAYGTGVFVDGTLTGINAIAINLRGTRSDDSVKFSNSVEISETGIVRSLGDYDSPKDAVKLFGDNSSFTNLGQVSASGDGVSFRYSDDGAFTNHGHVSGNQSGVEFTLGRHLDIVNTGVISGEQSVVIDSSGGVLNNSGTLDGQVLLQGDRFEVFRLKNSGEISGPDDAAIDASDYGGRLHIRNTGDIWGGETNKGTDAIIGSDDNDIVRNAGTIFGDIDLGDGGDSYLAHGDGSVDGWVSGGAGNDIFRGGTADDQFSGGAGFDYLYGRGGDDSLLGGRGQ